MCEAAHTELALTASPIVTRMEKVGASSFGAAQFDDSNDDLNSGDSTNFMWERRFADSVLRYE